jgi:hypothetical protein
LGLEECCSNNCIKQSTSADLLQERERTWLGTTKHKNKAVKILMASRINSTDNFVSNFSFDFKLLNGKPICETGMRKILAVGHNLWYRNLALVKAACSVKVDLRANNPDLLDFEDFKFSQKHGAGRTITSVYEEEVKAWLIGYGDANGDQMPDRMEVRVPFFLFQVYLLFCFTKAID